MAKTSTDVKQSKLNPGFQIHAPTELSRLLEKESSSSRRSVTAIINLALQEWLKLDPVARSVPRVSVLYPEQTRDAKIYFRFDDGLRSALKAAAPQHGVSMNEALVGIIHDWLVEGAEVTTATMQEDGSCTVDLPPGLFRDIGGLIQGASREETVRLCLQEMCYSSDVASDELSYLLRAAFMINPMLATERKAVELYTGACLVGGQKDVMSRARLRFALRGTIDRLGVHLGSDADGKSILAAAKILTKKRKRA